MPTSFFEMLVILLLTIANGLFSMSEMAFVSSRKARLQLQAAQGNERAREVLTLVETPNRFLSTVQIGITMIGTLAGAFGGATIATELAASIGHIAWLAPYQETLALLIVVSIITYLSLILGELVPKRVALNAPERIAMLAVRPMRVISILATPLIAFLSISAEGVLRLFHIRLSAEPSVTKEEITFLLEQGWKAGVFAETERDLVKHVFRLGNRRVSTLMTPRIDIIWLDITDPVERIHATIVGSAMSRFPVCQETLDNVLGIVHVKDLYAHLAAEQSMNLRAILHPAVFVPESTRAFTLLERFKQTNMPLALVIQEYGQIEGLITLTDVLEAIVGELPQTGEPGEREAIQREDGSWLLDGALPVDELKETLHLKRLPDEEQGNYETLGGLVMHQLGRIPSAGDYFTWEDWRFEVMDMDGHRVDKVLAQPVP